MVMEAKYYAEEVIGHPILIWEYDWMPRDGTPPVHLTPKKQQPMPWPLEHTPNLYQRAIKGFLS